MRLLRAGFDMKDISDKLRHKSIETTAQIYARYNIEDKIKVQMELSQKLNKEFAPYDLDFEEIVDSLLEGDDDE